ncbi:MAG: 50S ribosomal protein L9 [Elusimicrobiales bacterium]|jgi:large subunit ribosomal protein L9|nr:50S ribosomal protein L9 [Elusimicrobiales bacterium]
MKVILKKDYIHLGREAEIKDVRDGYARNFLIPKGIAIISTDGAMKSLKTSEERRKKKLEQKKKALEEMAKKISEITLSFSKTKNEEGHMFGSVAKSDIIKALKAVNIEIDKEQIDMPSSLKEFGVSEVKINLSIDVRTSLKVNITAA